MFLFDLAITFAMVKVLPEPVTPRSVCLPFCCTPLASLSIAAGWSPLGANTFASSNCRRLVAESNLRDVKSQKRAYILTPPMYAR